MTSRTASGRLESYDLDGRGALQTRVNTEMLHQIFRLTERREAAVADEDVRKLLAVVGRCDPEFENLNIRTFSPIVVERDDDFLHFSRLGRLRLAI